MKKKTTRTFSISDDIWEKFIEVTNRNKINRSRLIEDYIEKYIESNEEVNSIDLVLDKISKFGINSLSKGEKRLLENQ